MPVSCGLLDADVAFMDRAYLGRVIAPVFNRAKLSVMGLAAGAAASGARVTFNNMSGIQAFANAVFLFVNIGGACYPNAFLDGGAAITWFAQVRARARGAEPAWPAAGALVCGARVTCAQASQSPATPVVARLLAAVEGAPRADPVLLFCRGGPDKGYVYCGKVVVRETQLGARPLRFVWRLVDFEALRRSEPFCALLRADAGADADSV